MGARKQVVLRAAVVIGIAAAGLSVVATPATADQSLVTLLSAGDPGTVRVEGASFAGATPDGSHVYFEADDDLLPSDTDGVGRDVYERTGGVTTLISTGPTDAQTSSSFANFAGVSADGSRVFFSLDRPADLRRHRRVVRPLRAEERADHPGLAGRPARGREQPGGHLRRRVDRRHARLLQHLRPAARLRHRPGHRHLRARERRDEAGLAAGERPESGRPGERRGLRGRLA